jgi:hypothetical protein
MKFSLRTSVVIALSVSATGACWAAEIEPGRPANAAVDRILTALQKRSDGLKDIRCDVVFTDEDKVNLTKNVKEGRIKLMVAKPNAHFLVHFDKTTVDGVRGKQEWYLFDGVWFYQAIERLEQVTRQLIAGSGQSIDLFDIEKAPFPMPFGQKKENILKNFEVRLAEPTGADPPETDHLICNPKPKSRLARRYDQLDLYVHRKLNLPARIVVTKNNGMEVSTAEFSGLSEDSLNTGVDRKDFEKPSAWKKYKDVVDDIVPVENEP